MPIILVTSSEDEDEQVVTNVKKIRKHEDEYRLISDLSGFDNLRAMVEADALLRAKRMERRKTNKKETERKRTGKTEKITSVNVETELENPLIFLESSEDEEASNVKKRKYEDEYKRISDLTGFDNLRALIEAEALRRRNKRKRNTKKVPGKNMAERVEKSIPLKMESKIEKPMILIASSKDGDANMDKRKLEDEYKVISDLSGFVNLRDMYEAEATVRTKKRKSPKRRRKKIECNAQERVSVDATNEMKQLDRNQALESTEALVTESVEMDPIPKTIPQDSTTDDVNESTQPTQGQGILPTQ
ncbi:uncharacterized protein LOC122316480 isoform X4 [Carya illinoinensis]|nr:uncharacterized protein LOC122316480 isoform X3 [Carya illinoinensis]XP_042988966.1 uncharacterized protein LOC122316480 isoform X4 [Carya illinoinensis]XP_042988967.1 uncharacterized protein LOC122316480 isoform X3 [Carya illinoinensis]XP_042988968.1 uncharacterized protein LOC122316480 isoform X4 [Carya illinoinensis]